jgi:hypothetical protein
VTTSAAAGAGESALARRVDTLQVGSLAALGLAIVLWAVSLRPIDVGRMTDLGLVSVLPPLVFASLLVLTLSFSVVVTLRSRSTGLLLLHVLVLIVLLYALATIIEPATRFSVSWRHAGIVDVLARTGQIDPAIDAYFSWPGFFTLGTLLTQAAGLSTALDLAPWAPLAFNLLYLPAILLVMRAGTTNPRVVWTGVWIFFVGNWIGQDYFSPQGFDYFLYVLTIGILLTWFRTAPQGSGWFASRFRPIDEPPSVALTPFQRAAMMSVIVLIFATTVYSHQLTPFALLGIVIVLTLIRRLSVSGLPVLMAVVLGTWLSYMTVQYLSGHISQLIERIGNVDTTVTANLTDRLRGSNLHLIVLAIRLATTAGLFGLAAIGTLHRWFSGRRDLTWPILAFTPFGLLLLQSYGGEMLLRVYLFSLPFTAFLAAYALVEWGSAERLRRVIPVALVTTLLLASFLVSRYGNERMDAPTTKEVAGMDQLYQIAPHDALLVAVADTPFWKYRDYELYHYATVTDFVVTDDVAAILARMRQTATRPAFLVVSSTQRAALELQYGLPSSTWQILQNGLLADPAVRLVYINPDIQIFEMTPRAVS